MNDHCSVVAAVLATVGIHRWVRVEVNDVSVLGDSIEIDLVIHYACATPVCCGEPTCYIGFLGQHRKRLPDALGTALRIASPAITIRAQLRYEPGYRHIDHRTGRLVDVGVDQLITFRPDQFQ